MKFGKEFEERQVPEWAAAYVDYNGLKQILQDIRRFNHPPTPLQQKSTFYRTFSGLNLQTGYDVAGDVEDQVIVVNAIQEDNSKELYRTKFLKSPGGEGGENEVVFFKKLDGELNKANAFYKEKVEEVMKEAALLNKQMDALIALRMKVMDPDFDASISLRLLSEDINNSTPSRVTSPFRPTIMDQDRMFFAPKMDISSKSADPLEILNHVKIVNTFESPMSTIRGVLRDSKENDLRFKKVELKKVEERLKIVFIEFYQKLRLLKHYSHMNLTAFSKILKKYEKITSRRVARSYMKMVDKSYLGSSEEVSGILDRVESTFIKHFANANRRKGMKILRPKPKREKHRITFLSGFFFGCSVALLVSLLLLNDTQKLMDKEDGATYLDNIIPLYSFYAYIVLHMLLYAANIYVWKRCKINYVFIFGFKQGTELSYREVFLLSNGLAMVVLATFLLHLHIKIDSGTHQEYGKFVEFFPLGLVAILLVILFCPFNIIYRSSRLFLVKTLLHCVCAPLYKVSLADFFLADQLTSQVEAIRSLEYYVCYYGWDDPSERQEKCHSHNVYNTFYFVLAVIPYWFRFLQCVRRLVEEKDMVHLYNGMRYFLTIVAVVVRTVFELKESMYWKVLAILISAIATIMNTYWDIVVDWGLMRRKSRNFLLRDKLLVPYRSVYIIAMVLDVLLRFAWLQLVLKFNMASLQGNKVGSIFSCLEILRRGVWSFFRLENEHLNNVGKYRAFKSVPLPFTYHDEEGYKDE